MRSEISENLFELASLVDRAKIDALNWSERDNMLRKQIAGCLLSRAALNGVSQHRLAV